MTVSLGKVESVRNYQSLPLGTASVSVREAQGSNVFASGSVRVNESATIGKTTPQIDSARMAHDAGRLGKAETQ